MFIIMDNNALLQLHPFMCGDLSALQLKSAKIIHQNRLTYLCITVVNRLGNSSSHQKNSHNGRRH